jgi:nucleoside-diphosphate-sugar epimerase
MRTLIVGCGYVGLALGAELARQGHEVFGLRRSSPPEMQPTGIIPLCGDITRPETLAALPRNFDWVVNCAASGGGQATDYWQLYFEGNQNLMAWLASSPPRKFVYTSSTSVYAQDDGSVVTEESPTAPSAETARILVDTEQLLLAAARARFPAVILRVAGIYGPGRGHAFKQLLRGEARIEGDGGRHMNMIHRQDVAGAIVAALTRGTPGEIYNAVDNEPVTQLTFFTWLAGELGVPVPPVAASGPELSRKRGVTNKRVDNSKLRTQLGFAPRFPNFRAGYGAEICALRSAQTGTD